MDQNPHGATARMGTQEQATARLRAARPLAYPDLYRRFALQWLVCAVHLRRTDQWSVFSRLGRTTTRTSASARRHRCHGQSGIAQVGRRAANDPVSRCTALVLPPCSPDLNPIEQAFAKVKHWMRDDQKRTIGETWRHIGHLVSTIELNECANYVRNAGYVSAKT